MRFSRLAWALALLALPSAQAPAADAPAAAQSVRIQQASVEDPGHPPITVAIWTSGDGAGAPAPAAAAASGAGLPLVLISHGTGAGPISHVDTAQALAEAGFVVVAPMHPGDNFQDDSAVGKPEWLASRSRHVSRVIDYMFGQWGGRKALKPGRVGIFGFSAGATTALISAGGVPDLDRVAGHCARGGEFVCALIKPAPGAAPPEWVHDSRIAAAVVVAPGLGFAFEPSGLSAVKVPVQLWAGAADQTVPYDSNAGVVRRLLAGAVEFHSVDKAVHLSFLAPCGPGTPPQLCQDAEGFDRAAFHREFNRAVVGFFRTHLAGGDGGR
jgi:predicted dienelactone hydrolase